MRRRILLVALLLIATQMSVGCCGRRAYVRAMKNGGVYTPDSPGDCCTPACDTCMKPNISNVEFGSPIAIGTPVSNTPMPISNPAIGIQEGVISPVQPIAPLPAPMSGNPISYIRPIR